MPAGVPFSNLPTTLPPSLLEAARSGPRAIAEVVDAMGGAPLQQGRDTTFLYAGEADNVRLQHWMDVFPALPPFSRHHGTSLWSLTIALPERSRIEYKLSVDVGGQRRLIVDPLNPRRARDPFGTNSVVTGPRYERPAWSQRQPGVPAGSIEYFDVDSAVFGDRRRLGLYVPHDAGRGPHPLLVAHDGTEYVAYAALAIVLDNLIAAGDLPPVACLLTDPEDRRREYTADPRHADHIVAEALPAAAARLSVDASRRIALGASLGGVASLHAAWRHPGTFSGLILQSGSFVSSLDRHRRRGRLFAPVVQFMRTFAADPGEVPARIHVSCGRFDGLLPDNQAMADRLRRLGAAVSYEDAPDGHNWENWRDRLRAGLLHTIGR